MVTVELFCVPASPLLQVVFTEGRKFCCARRDSNIVSGQVSRVIALGRAARARMSESRLRPSLAEGAKQSCGRQ